MRLQTVSGVGRWTAAEVAHRALGDADAVSFGFTDHDRTLAFDGTDFEPESGLTASEVRSGSDLSVDAQDAEGVLTSDTITETDILDGRWDNAAVEVWRVNWDAVGQRVLMRRGAVGQVRLVYAELDDNPVHLMAPEGWTNELGTPWPYLNEYRVGCTLEHAGYYLTRYRVYGLGNDRFGHFGWLYESYGGLTDYSLEGRARRLMLPGLSGNVLWRGQWRLGFLPAGAGSTRRHSKPPADQHGSAFAQYRIRHPHR